jgi:hypothetical protein
MKSMTIKREAAMNKWILVLVGMMMVGCAKDGAKAHLTDGGQSQAPQPTLVDRPLPGPNGNPTP